MKQIDFMRSEDIARLHRRSIRHSKEIRKLLESAYSQSVSFTCGINERNEERQARITNISDDRVIFETTNFGKSDSDQSFFSFEFQNVRYFFAARRLKSPKRNRFEISVPDAIHEVERRSRERVSSIPASKVYSHVEIQFNNGITREGKVIDVSLYGVGVELQATGLDPGESSCSVRFVGGPRDGERTPAEVRHLTHLSESKSGWIRFGLSLGTSGPSRLIPIDRKSTILPRTTSERLRENAAFLGAVVADASTRVSQYRLRHSSERIQIESFRNESGQRIAAIVDRWGDPQSATAVVIPPAWGRTKETLLPLASTIVETFKRAGEPIFVIRFDGTNRRGESHIDFEFQSPGNEYLGFTFSQATRDIEATLDYLSSPEGPNPKRIVLVTFSLSSIEGRRAVALDFGRRISGWLSVVGMADLQSALKTISGGVDYALGLSKGIRFGKHELVGVLADMDRTGIDAIQNRMVFFEDAKRDMASIEVPVTWIHGRDDAWMSIHRVREMLSIGETMNRKLLEVPTGHQLRTSREAMATFQLISEEISELTLGRRLKAELPSLPHLSRRNAAERLRRPRVKVDLRSFWEGYLLGRKRRAGFALLAATSTYKAMMNAQVAELAIGAGDTIVDLGAGTGEFSSHLTRSMGCPRNVSIYEVDFVKEALQQRYSVGLDGQRDASASISRVVADLNVNSRLSIPLISRICDGAIASLLVSYLQDPRLLLKEAYRVLRPGGKLVASTLRRDADISRLYVEGLAELRSSEFKRDLRGIDEGDFEEIARDFLNDASRILDFEEDGIFSFWEPDEFEDLVRSVGFESLRSKCLLGDPPQAIVVSARRPLASQHDLE